MLFYYLITDHILMKLLVSKKILGHKTTTGEFLKNTDTSWEALRMVYMTSASGPSIDGFKYFMQKKNDIKTIFKYPKSQEIQVNQYF